VPFEALPVSVPWGAAGFSLLVIGASLPFALGQQDPFLTSERAVVMIPIFIGYSIAAASMVIRSALQSLEALRPQLGCSQADFELLVRGITRQKAGSAVAAALVGVVVWFSVTLYFRALVDPPTLATAIIPALGLLQWVIASSALWVVLSISLAFRWIGAHLPRIDLFGLEALAPFQRVGLRMALITFGLAAVRFLLVIRPGLVGYLAVTTGAMIVVGSAALLLPLWGVRARVADEKRQELAAVKANIRRERVRGCDGPGRPSRELLDLLEYKERVESLREWLFDAPTFFRFLLYLGIPLLGWVGGALVERVFDAFLSP
jgi:hypothetical protein